MGGDGVSGWGKGVMVSSDLKIENSFLQEFSTKYERTGEREVEGKTCEQ
jgi:hypothetical protein